MLKVWNHKGFKYYCKIGGKLNVFNFRYSIIFTISFFIEVNKNIFFELIFVKVLILFPKSEIYILFDIVTTYEVINNNFRYTYIFRRQ